MAMNGRDLRVLRKRCGLTQMQLAAVLEITPQYVGMMERGAKEIQPHMERSIRTVIGGPSDVVSPDGATLTEAKAAVLAGLHHEPRLTTAGFPYRDHSSRNPFEIAKDEYERRAALFSNGGLAQIETAIAWIDTVKIVKDLKTGSYAAKHRAEDWGRENGLVSYVSNGALVAAAIYRQVPFKRVPDSPNAILGLELDPVPEAKTGSFTAWLRSQVHRHDPIGDLARDAADDTTFPIHTNSKTKLRSYLYSKHACDGAQRALDKAHSAWSSESER
ncbi:MAG: YozE family protein [Dongiaceae bacterium]